MLAIWLKTFSLFDKAEKVKICTLFGWSVVIGLIQLGGIASIMPFVAVLTSPGLIETQPLLARVYDAVGFDSPRTFVIALGFLSFAVLVIGHLLELYYSWASIRFISLKESELSTALLTSYLTDDFERTSNRNTSELSKNILEDVEKVISGILLSGMNIVNGCLSAVFIVALLLFMDPWVTLSIAAVFVACYGAIFLMLSPEIRKLGGEVKDFYAQMYINTQQALDGLKEIKAGNSEPHFVRKFAAPRHASAANFIRYSTMELIPKQLLEVTAFGTIIGISLYLLYQSTDPGINYSILAMYAFAAYRIIPVVKLVFDSMERFDYFRTFIDGLWDDLNRMRGPVGGERLPPSFGTIERVELRDIRFSYASQSEPALRGVSLMIERREWVCLVGPSGAGKTTAVDILLGLLTPQRGSVLVNGMPVTPAELEAVRTRIGYVPQNAYLLDDDLAGNIVFGADDGDRKRLAEAYETAGLIDVFGPFGDAALHTQIGQSGLRVSGGQRQRIAIARALYRHPDLLILDESTNELDLATERALLTRLSKLEGTAILFVSHRPSIMKTCRRVIVMDEGRIAARGSFEDLAKDERYEMLVREPDDAQRQVRRVH